MLTDEEAMELMAEDMVIDLPIKHESKPYLMIPLPDGATNGDVVKALFPAIETTDFYMTVHATTKVERVGVTGSISFDFWKEWWNAPYKGGRK